MGNKQMSTESKRLTLNVNSFVEKSVGVLSKCIDDYASEQNKFLYQERSLARQKASQQHWLQKRAAENELRAKQGQPPLPDDRSKLSIFKQQPKPWKLDSYLIANRMKQQCNTLLSDSAQG